MRLHRVLLCFAILCTLLGTLLMASCELPFELPEFLGGGKGGSATDGESLCEHAFGDYSVTTPPTCSAEGVETRTCSLCGETETRAIAIDPAAHTDGAWVTDKEATCGDAGSKHVSCATCGTTLRNEEIKATGNHTDGEWITDRAETCGEDGAKHQICATCGDTLEEETIPATGNHTAGEWKETKAPTCAVEGEETLYCGVCDAHMDTRAIGKTSDHTAGEWIIDKHETCGEDGSKHQICATCGATVATDTIPATGNHNHQKTSTVPPTVSTDGYSVYTCSVCNDSYHDDVVPYLGSAGLLYSVNPDGETCTVTGLGNCTDTHIYIPSYIDGYRVTGIGASAFNGEKKIVLIWMTDTVEFIETQAFSGCTSLTTIRLSNSLTALPNYMLEGCRQLASAEIPESVETIGACCFFASGLVSVRIPASVTYIGEAAFTYAYRLAEIINESSVALPDGTVALEVHTGESRLVREGDFLFYTFGGVNYLMAYAGESDTVVTPDNYRGEAYSIYDFAFAYSTTLKTLTIEGQITALGKTVCGDSNSLTTVTVGEGITEIPASTFSSCEKLTEIVLPQSVKTIGDYAFSYCYKLTKITLPDGLESLGANAFYYCSALPKITVPAGVKTIEKSTFEECTSLIEADLKGVVTIDDCAFMNCSALITLHLPADLRHIGLQVFKSDRSYSKTVYFSGTVGDWCEITFEEINYSTPLVSGGKLYIGGTLLTTAVIPEGTQKVSDYAFYDYYYLKTLTVPGSVKSIGRYAFHNTDLTTVVIEEGVETIGDYGFSYTSMLKSLTLPSTLKSIGEDCFYNGWSETPDYDVYYTGDLASWFGITLASRCSSPTCNGSDLYVQGNLVTELVIPEEITSIGRFAFYKVKNIQRIVIHENVTNIGEEAFYGSCMVLYLERTSKPYGYETNWALGQSLVWNYKEEYTDAETGLVYALKNDGTAALVRYDDNAEYVNIVAPEGYALDHICQQVFTNKYKIVTLIMPNTVKRIDNYNFPGCTKLKTIVLSSALTTVGDEVFGDYYGVQGPDILYGGTATMYKKISFGRTNGNAQREEKLYYYSETQPTSSGNYWYKDENGNPVKW